MIQDFINTESLANLGIFELQVILLGHKKLQNCHDMSWYLIEESVITSVSFLSFPWRKNHGDFPNL